MIPNTPEYFQKNEWKTQRCCSGSKPWPDKKWVHKLVWIEGVFSERVKIPPWYETRNKIIWKSYLKLLLKVLLLNHSSAATFINVSHWFFHTYIPGCWRHTSIYCFLQTKLYSTWSEVRLLHNKSLWEMLKILIPYMFKLAGGIAL